MKIKFMNLIYNPCTCIVISVFLSIFLIPSEKCYLPSNHNIHCYTYKHAGNIVQPESEIAQLLTGSIYPTNHRERRRQL